MEQINELAIICHEIKVLIMPVPKSCVPGRFPVFEAFDITKKREVYALGNDYIMIYDIFYDPASQDRSCFVHGELQNIIMEKAGFTLEDDFTEYKYHFVPQKSESGLVITNVKERYNSQTAVYKELLKTLCSYTDVYYGNR